MSLTNSTVSGNSGDYGGGIYNDEGTVHVTNSTVSGNTASWGGGIFNDEGTVHLTNSTVSGNTASEDGGGIYNEGDGATVNLTNTIVADQLAGEDCSGAGPATSNGYNLDSDGSCNLTQPNDKPNNPSANLGPLQLNAPGNTATHALLAGSDAVDTGDCTGGTVTTDQRGVPRPQGDACDMGAYEFQGTTIPGDCNGDGEVDLDDYTGFEACLLGPDGGLGTGCECFDFDDDGDVDAVDFLTFQLSFTGP